MPYLLTLVIKVGTKDTGLTQSRVESDAPLGQAGKKKTVVSSRSRSKRGEKSVPQLGRPRKPRTGFEKAELAKFLGEGERIAAAFVVVRARTPVSSRYTPALEYSLFVNVTGMRGYFSYLGANIGGQPRVFKSFDRLLTIVRELGYLGVVSVYDEDDPLRPGDIQGQTLRRPGDKTDEQNGRKKRQTKA